MSLLSDAQVTSMQTTQDTGLPGTAVIYQRSDTSDGMGGYTEEWIAAGTADARLQIMISRGDTEYVTGGQVTQVLDWWLTMPVDTTITAADRIRFGDRAFEVSYVNNDESWRTACRVECISMNEESARQLPAAAATPEVGNPYGLLLLFTYPS